MLDNQTHSCSGYDIHIIFLNSLFNLEPSPIKAEMNKESPLLQKAPMAGLKVAPISASKQPSAEVRTRHSGPEYFIALAR